MLARIEPRPLAGTIPAIPSKSHVHRLLLAAAAFALYLAATLLLVLAVR